MYTDELFDYISQKLTVVQMESCNFNDSKPAAVALILRQTLAGIELLFIERAHHPDDPWSGNIGLPGGRRAPIDKTIRHTAERETLEEVGIDLTNARYLGRLPDVIGTNLPVRVSCFVYGLTSSLTPVISDEVNDLFWVGIGQLLQPQNHIITTVSFGGKLIEAPAIDMKLPGKMVLWGLTYRLVCCFKELLWPDGKLSDKALARLF